MDELITSAIEDKHLIEFRYHDLLRIAEPHVYGVLDGKRQLLTYQVGGQSSSGDLPNWRRVNLDEVSGLRVLDERFAGPRPRPSGKSDRFDRVIAVVK